MVTHLKSVCLNFGCIGHYFVHEFLELCVFVPRLLPTRIALNSRDFLVWLALLGVPRVVPLALVKVAVAIALLVWLRLGKRSFSSSSWSAHVPSCHAAPQ
jgi:hypothetical protein